MSKPRSLSERIAQVYPGLSPAHRRAADELLHRPVQVATASADQWAQRLGLSNATLSRFARALGFDDYAQFREDLVRECAALIEPVERLRSGRKHAGTVGDIVADALDQDMRNLKAIRAALSPELCEEAVRMILAARRVHIVGMGASAHLAALFVSALEPYHRLVIPTVGSGGATEVSQRLMHVGPSDLVIALAFPRYARDIVSLAAFVRDRGCPILALTDRPSSPLVPHAGLVIYVNAQRSMLPTSNAAVLAVIEALVSAVAFKAPDAIRAAQGLAESLGQWLYGVPVDATPNSSSAPDAGRRTRN